MRIDDDQFENFCALEECNLQGLLWLRNFGDALAFTANPPHQQGLRQGAPIGYGSALPPTAMEAQCLRHLLVPRKDLPRRKEANKA